MLNPHSDVITMVKQFFRITQLLLRFLMFTQHLLALTRIQIVAVNFDLVCLFQNEIIQIGQFLSKVDGAFAIVVKGLMPATDELEHFLPLCVQCQCRVFNLIGERETYGQIDGINTRFLTFSESSRFIEARKTDADSSIMRSLSFRIVSVSSRARFKSI